MIQKAKLLGTFEEMVLLAVVHLSPQAYGMTIRREISRRCDRETSIGAVYATLERLESKGYLVSSSAPAGIERQGRARRFFALRPLGAAALLEVRQVRQASWKGIEPSTVLEAVES